jgi:hypothetical protein
VALSERKLFTFFFNQVCARRSWRGGPDRRSLDAMESHVVRALSTNSSSPYGGCDVNRGEDHHAFTVVLCKEEEWFNPEMCKGERNREGVGKLSHGKLSHA